MSDFSVKSGETLGGDPRGVADVIAAASADASTPLHTLVGDDVVGFVAAVEECGTF